MAIHRRGCRSAALATHLVQPRAPGADPDGAVAGSEHRVDHAGQQAVALRMRHDGDVAHSVQAVLCLPTPSLRGPIQGQDARGKRRAFLEPAAGEAVKIAQARTEPQITVRAVDEYLRHRRVRQVWSAMPRRSVPGDQDDAGIARVNQDRGYAAGFDLCSENREIVFFSAYCSHLIMW